jgi:hypothetical protein
VPYPVFGQICVATFLVPAAVGIIRFRNLGKATRILAILSFAACLQIVGGEIASWITKSNYLVTDIYRGVEAFLLCAFFYYCVEEDRRRRLLKGMGFVFAFVWIMDLIFLRTPGQINSNLAIVSRLFLIAMSSVALSTLLDDDSKDPIIKPVFWAAAGVVLYSAGTLVTLALSNYLLKLGMPYFEAGWRVNWTLLILSNLLYTKAMMCNYQM